MSDAVRQNPVDDRSFTGPLVRALRGHVDRVAASLPGQHPDRDRQGWEIAAAWVYLTVLVAWAEDHGLVDPWLREEAKPRRVWFLANSTVGPRGWLVHAFAALAVHPATWCLADPRYTPLREAAPSQEACQELLDWWAADAPSLAYDTGTGPASVTGWLPGDLLQAMSDSRRKQHALVQTPWWVVDLILDLTLREAAGEFSGQPLRVVDPCCGTGHFLTRAAGQLYQLYTTGDITAYLPGAAPVAGRWAAVGPAGAVGRILTGLHGVEIDPLTAAVARLRMLVTVAALLHQAGALPGPLRLDRIPHTIRPAILVGDSLLMGVLPWADYQQIHPRLAAVYASETHLFGGCRWPEQAVQADLFGDWSSDELTAADGMRGTT